MHHFSAVVALAFVAMVAVCFADESDVVLDQHTDQSRAARNIHRGRLWQEFKPKSTGQLLRVDVYMGTREPCHVLKGQLHVREGHPDAIQNGWQSNNVINETIHTQEVRTMCDEFSLVCEDGDCLKWHSWTLSKPLAVEEGKDYALVLTGFTSSDKSVIPRVGVAPSTLNNGGEASLLTSPIFATKYSQFAFRTWMSSSQGTKSFEFNEIENEDMKVDDEVRENIDSSESSSSSTTTIVVSVFAVLVFLAVVLFLVARKRRTEEKYATSHMGSAIAPSESGSASSGTQLLRSHHPIHVRSKDQDDSERWAEASASPYRHFTKKTEEVAPTSRMSRKNSDPSEAWETNSTFSLPGSSITYNEVDV